MTFFAPSTPPTERAKQPSPAHVAATFQQRPHINTTDLILEMARKEKKERKGVRIRDNQSPTLLRGFPVIPTSGFTFGRRFIAYFFSGLAATDVWCVTAHYPFIFQSQSVSTRVKVQCLPWLDTSYTPRQMRCALQLQVFVCSDSLQIKVLPSPPLGPHSLSRHSTFCPTLSRAAAAAWPHHTSQEFFALLLSGSTPENNSGQGDEAKIFI